jgi:hypothetical protein
LESPLSVASAGAGGEAVAANTLMAKAAGDRNVWQKAMEHRLAQA